MPLSGLCLRAFVASVFLLVGLASGGTPAFAVQPDEILQDTTMEQRARALSRELRCMVCQNQSIDDSDAPLARDLRILVRERLKAGDSDTQVISFLTSRYGDFVLLKPRFTFQTAFLWIAPLVVLGAGVLGLWFLIRRRPSILATASAAEASPLTPEEQQRLSKMMQRDALK